MKETVDKHMNIMDQRKVEHWPYITRLLWLRVWVKPES